jgi:8-oxo-dGTP pyrophosphatase MutT (NUDIX family)
MNIRKAAIAIIQHPNNPELYLGVTRGKSDKIGLPGGKIEEGETPWEAVVREVYEETNLEVLYGSLVHVGKVLPHEANDHWTHVETDVYVYFCEVSREQFHCLQGSDEGQPVWRTEKEFIKDAFGKFNTESFAALKTFLKETQL